MRGKRGPNGKPIALVESVKQDRKKHITRFEQEFVEGRGKSRDAQEVHARVPDAVGAADGPAVGKGRLRGLVLAR